MHFCQNHKGSSQAGSSIIEVIVAMVLLLLVALASTWSVISGLRFQKYNEISTLAMNLAVSKAEVLSGVRIDLLTDAYDSTETALTISGHALTFTRVTDVTVNADGSRTIHVAVSSSSSYLPNDAEYTTTFAPWES